MPPTNDCILLDTVNPVLGKSSTTPADQSLVKRHVPFNVHETRIVNSDADERVILVFMEAYVLTSSMEANVATGRSQSRRE